MVARRDRLPTVALVGRQNVGKSTLFNTLLEERRALVSPIAGTTRDRNFAVIRWRGTSFTIIDTGGVEASPAPGIPTSVRRHALRAATSSDLVCFVVDGTTPRTSEDEHLAALLRKRQGDVVLVLNKIDNPRARATVSDDYRAMGFSPILTISAKNGAGTGDLLDTIVERLRTHGTGEPHEPELRVALIGKPNVGKSSLVNRIVGEERSIVSPEPHTTRDTQDTLITVQGKRIRLIDTAGIRRQARRRESRIKDVRDFEALAVAHARRALTRADVVALVLEANQPVTQQDKHLAQLAVDAGVGVVLVVNKWDTIPDKDAMTNIDLQRLLAREMPFIQWAPIVVVSAVTGQRLPNILSTAWTVAANRSRTYVQEKLDTFLHRALLHRSPPRDARRRHMTIVGFDQVRTSPPTFRVTTAPKQTLPEAYRRYLLNQLRTSFDFAGTPIRLIMEQQRRR